MNAPFGGSPGSPIPQLTPNLNPPGRGYRLLSGFVWWVRIFWSWRQFIAARSMNIPAVPPLLAAATAPGIYFTDLQSLQGLLNPADFAIRLSLNQQTQIECLKYGCAVVEFDVPFSTNIITPSSYPGIAQGRTAGGAREWFLQNNISLHESMIVKYIDTINGAPRFFEIPL